MKRTDPISKPKLFIEELEMPVPAEAGDVTTLAIGEESGGKVTSQAIGEEAIKNKIKAK